MLSEWLSYATIVAIYLGFAGLEGFLISRVRAHKSRDAIIASISFSVLVFAPSTLWLPFTFIAKLAVWASAFILIWLFASRPPYLPSWVWSLRFGLRYAAASMSMILLWSVLDQQSLWLLVVDALAAVAGGWAWLHSRALEA